MSKEAKPCRDSPRALSPHSRWLRWLLLAGLLALVDQAVKISMTTFLPLNARLEVASFFNLVHVLNPGAAFSFLADAGGWQRYAFLALALMVSAWLIWMLRQNLPPVERLAYALILAGALGNAGDRAWRGAVVDFLDFHWRGVHWPAFNLADVAISVGVVCLITASVYQSRLARHDMERG